MRKLDFYEFTGVIAPGIILVLGVSWLYPEMRLFFWNQNITLGEFGLLLILAYVVGHLVQSLGNLLERFWWNSIRLA